MATYKDYTDYFKGLAVEFLGHSDNEKHFFRKGLDEFLNSQQTTVNYPAMLLDRFDFAYADYGGDNVQEPLTAAFIVCDYCSDNQDYDRIDEIMDSTKLLIDKIYNRIRADREQPTGDFLKYADLGSVKCTPVSNYADGAFGWFVTVEITSIHNTAIL